MGMTTQVFLREFLCWKLHWCFENVCLLFSREFHIAVYSATFKTSKLQNKKEHSEELVVYAYKNQYDTRTLPKNYPLKRNCSKLTTQWKMTLGIKRRHGNPHPARHWYRNRSMKTISSMNRIIIGRKLQKVRSFHTKMRDLIDISEIVTKTSVRKRNNWRYTYQAFHTELFRCLQWNWITH